MRIYFILILTILIFIILFFIDKYFNNQNNNKNYNEYFTNNENNENNDIYDKEFVEMYEIIYRDNSDIDYDYKIFNKYVKEKNRIAVLGSGVGKMCKKLKEMIPNADIIGIDKSENMIIYSKKKYPNIKFKQADITKSNALEGKYDIIILDERTLYYNTNQKKIIDNCAKWLNNNGILVVPIYDPENLQLASRYYSLNYIDDKGNKHGFTYLNDFSHDGYYIKDEIKNNNKYNYYDKIVLKDGTKRIKKTTFYIQTKEKTYDIILKKFKVIHIEPIHTQILGGYELGIFRKK